MLAAQLAAEGARPLPKRKVGYCSTFPSRDETDVPISPPIADCTCVKMGADSNARTCTPLRGVGSSTAYAGRVVLPKLTDSERFASVVFCIGRRLLLTRIMNESREDECWATLGREWLEQYSSWSAPFALLNCSMRMSHNTAFTCEHEGHQVTRSVSLQP